MNRTRVTGRKSSTPTPKRRRRISRAAARRRFWTSTKRASDYTLSRMQPGRRAEYFTATEIHERDNWTCQICGQPVNQRLKFPEPDSPSIDHITPLENGGEHTRENVRCTHLRCNQQRPKGEQATLTETPSEGPRWGDRDVARSRQLIASHNHTVQAILEQNRDALNGFPLTLDMIAIAHVTTCKNSVTNNGRSRIEESGKASILGMWCHFGFDGNGTTVRVARDILAAIRLILRIDVTWSPRTYRQAGRCQRWVPVGHSWSLPILQRVNPDKLTPAQTLERGLYLAAQSRREQYEEHREASSGTNSQDEGVTLTTFSTQWSNHSAAFVPETYSSDYEPDQDEDEGVCINQYREPTVLWEDDPYLLDADEDEAGPAPAADWDVEHYAYEDDDDWAQAFDWDAAYEDEGAGPPASPEINPAFVSNAYWEAGLLMVTTGGQTFALSGDSAGRLLNALAAA